MYGLQLFNKNGKLIIDVTDRLLRFHSRVTKSINTYNTGSHSAVTANGSVAVPGMLDNGSWIVNEAIGSTIFNVKVTNGAITFQYRREGLANGYNYPPINATNFVNVYFMVYRA